MKAVIKTDYGPGCIEYTDIERPVCDEDGLIIKMKAAAICGSDLELRYGTVGGKVVPYPIVIGHEFMGEVVEVGPKAKRWKIGDRLVSDNTGHVCGHCINCATGKYLFCSERKGMGNDMDGGFSEYVKIPGEVLNTFPNCVHRVPDNVTDQEAAIIEPMCNGYKAVIQEGELHPGQTVVVVGVGSMGLFSINAAKLGGAGRIIAVGMKEDKAERFPLALKVGATDIVVSDEEENVVERIRSLAGPDGVAITIDAAGAGIVLQQAIDYTRNGGKIIKIGYTRKPLGFNLDWLALKGITLVGHMGYDTESWKNVLYLLEKGDLDLSPYISHVLPLSEFEKGIELVRDRKATKVVLIPDALMEEEK